MSRLLAAVTGLLLASAAANTAAEPRFYQVIDAQGQMQTLMVPDETSPTETATTPAPAEAPESRAAGAASTEPPASADIDTPVSLPAEGLPTATEDAGKETGVAPEAVDAKGADAEGEYVDSEELERSNFNPTKKKRFYLLDDSMGARVEESDGQLTGVVENGPDLFPQQTETALRVFETGTTEVTGTAALQSLLGKDTLCLDDKALAKAAALGRGIPQSVAIDRKAWSFVGEGGVVQVFMVGGEGLRKLTLHSYSKSDRKPSFVMPVIGVADRKGCLVRALTDGYFESWYGATKTRHHHLEGSLIMSSVEQFVLVVLPRRSLVREDAGFSLTDDGLFAVKWHE